MTALAAATFVLLRDITATGYPDGPVVARAGTPLFTASDRANDGDHFEPGELVIVEDAWEEDEYLSVAPTGSRADFRIYAGDFGPNVDPNAGFSINGEPTIDDLAEFLDANGFTPGMIAQMGALAVGEEMVIDGGAAAGGTGTPTLFYLSREW